MLTIRGEQMKVFETVALRNFEHEMVQHIKKFTPRHSEIIGEQGVRLVVRKGIEQAKKYGLISRGPVRFHIEMMFMFGSDFDTDPQYPWGSEILGDNEIADQMERADRLHDKAMDYIEKVSGFDHKYEEEAVRRFSRIELDDIPTFEGDLEAELCNLLNSIYPQKCTYIGEEAIHALLRRGTALAKSNAIFTNSAYALCTGLMFAFGHGCFADPQFPWIAGTLSNTSIANPNVRVQRLYPKMLTYFEKALAFSKKR